MHRRPPRCLSTRIAWGSLCALAGVAENAAAAPLDHQRIAPLMSAEAGARRAAQRALVKARAVELVPGLVDAVFFTPRRHRGEIVATLAALTGHDAGADYYAWVEWLGGRSDFAPGPGYAAWKSTLFGRIDPAYRRLLANERAARVRREEIVFGGARLDGIPALDDPPHVAAAAAPLGDDELVFGLVVGGEARAYPHRYLSWHEMANDVLGGEPIALSY